jgi:hypothetical protein
LRKATAREHGAEEIRARRREGEGVRFKQLDWIQIWPSYAVSSPTRSWMDAWLDGPVAVAFESDPKLEVAVRAESKSTE